MSLFFLTSRAVAEASGKKSGAMHWVISLGAPGVFGVSLLDATIIPLAIPGSTDLLLLWLISHGGNPWLLVGIAVAGTLIGGWTTWRLGKKGGKEAMKRYVPQRWEQRVQGWSQHHPMLSLFLPAILPPPIPLAPFLLAAGALGASWKRFVAAFGAGRALRYAFVGWLALRYGRPITRLWAETLDKWSAPILWTFIALTAAGIAFSVWKLRHNNSRTPNSPAMEPSRGD